MKKQLFICLFLISIKSFAKIMQYDLVKAKSPVEFEAKGNPSLLSIKGQKGQGSGTLKIEDGGLSGNVSVVLNDFDTDLDTRNEHMKEKYLETGKPGFAEAVLKFNSIALQKDFPEKIKKLEKQIIEAMLTLHGKEKKILCNADLTAEGSEISGKVNFKLKLSDYGIEVPSFAGITIEDEVVVNAQFKGTSKAP